jgi:hypothetical protein
MGIKIIGMDPLSLPNSSFVVNMDGHEIRQLEDLYKDQMEPDEWDGVVSSAARVLSHCPSPNESAKKVTGLALGKVQSGKTLSYTALIALAIDNGYRVTIVLAGTKNPLLVQTYGRLTDELNAKRLELTPFRNPSLNDFEVIQSILHTGGHALLIVLKTKKRISEMKELLDTPELRGFPVLIIDDEGDEASLNTQFRKGKKSAIYGSILDLRNALPLHAYVAYTATPQANLLISGLDALSPNFAELIEPGRGYCGGTVFFGRNKENYIRKVQGDDSPIIHINSDIKHAIAIFFVGGAIRSLRNDRNHHSMLLHTSERKYDHEQLKRSILAILQLWKEKTSLPEIDPSAGDFYGLIRMAYDDLCKTVDNPPNWADLKNRIKDEIWLTEVWMVNSLPLGRDPVANPIRLKNNIYIGGNMLGRGITIKGLAVTFITREARNETNADTLEQRARWFGYKRSYLDICRIFLTDRLISRYTELLQHEDDFWEALKRNQLQGISVQDWPRMFRLDTETWGLRPTRSQVAGARKFLGHGWETQRKLILDKSKAQFNVSLVKQFFKKYPGKVLGYGNVEHSVIAQMPIDTLIVELLSKVNVEGTDWEKSYLVEYLQRLFIGKKLRHLEVLQMSKGEPRERTMLKGGTFNPMQGKSPHRVPGDPDYYPGDEHIHNNNVQFQVHIINAREEKDGPLIETTAFALYIPNDPLYDLHIIVRENDHQPSL